MILFCRGDIYLESFLMWRWWNCFLEFFGRFWNLFFGKDVNVCFVFVGDISLYVNLMGE